MLKRRRGCSSRYQYASALFVIICFFDQASLAKDHSKWVSAPYHDWYERQLNGDGAWCCDNAEAHAYFGNYRYNKDGGVTLKLQQGDHIIPAHLIVKTPNPTGHAIWWYANLNGTRVDYCFAPGALY